MWFRYVGAYFSRLDTDRSGALDLNEFRSFYKRCLSSERCERIIASDCVWLRLIASGIASDCV